MKKIGTDKMSEIEGSGRCEATAGAILGLGLGVLAVPVTPLNIAFGLVVSAVGALGAASCPWT